jgi:uncharacterized protein HemX
VETATEVTPPGPVAPPPPTPPRRRGGLRFLVWLIVLAALGAGGWFGWQWWQQQDRLRQQREAQFKELLDESRRLRSRTDQLAAELRGDHDAVARNAADIAALNTRQQETASALARLGEAVQGGRTRMQLAAVEQLLLMANDRSLLAQDAAGAQQALAQADERLAGLNEPRLFKVREAIAAERAALAALPKADLTAATLTLSNLIRDLPKMPLQGRPSTELTAATSLSTPPDALPWHRQLWLSLKQALRAVFIVRHDASITALLPPEQETLVVHIGLLKLEGARLALLRGHTAAFRELTGASADWLRDYFEPRDPAVEAAQAALTQLRTLELAPALPDLSRSLALLREYLSAPP